MPSVQLQRDQRILELRYMSNDNHQFLRLAGRLVYFLLSRWAPIFQKRRWQKRTRRGLSVFRVPLLADFRHRYSLAVVLYIRDFRSIVLCRLKNDRTLPADGSPGRPPAGSSLMLALTPPRCWRGVRQRPRWWRRRGRPRQGMGRGRGRWG